MNSRSCGRPTGSGQEGRATPDQGQQGLLSPFLQRRRLAAALPFVRGRILDVGCGSGALASFVPAKDYAGVDVDGVALALARTRHPRHVFLRRLPPVGSDAFDTVVALAVIEHVDDIGGFLSELAARLSAEPGASIVVTTPWPALRPLHAVGAALGVFSRSARDEHKVMIGRQALAEYCAGSGLRIVAFRRFLLGVNQLAVLRRTR